MILITTVVFREAITEILKITVHRGHRYTVYTVTPYTPVHRGHRYTVDTGTPWTPLYRGNRYTVDAVTS